VPAEDIRLIEGGRFRSTCQKRTRSSTENGTHMHDKSNGLTYMGHEKVARVRSIA